MKKHSHIFLFILIFGLLAPYLVHADQFEIIRLQHRPASEIVPIIKPLVSDEGRISGEQYLIFIDTDRENLVQLKQIIASLDTKLRQLKLSVLYADERALARIKGQLNARIEIGENDRLNAQGRISATNRNLSRENIQTVQVTEGLWADLKTGFNVPTVTRSVNENGTVTESYHYRQVLAGFKIQPVLNGDVLLLNIKARQTRQSESQAGQYETRAIETSINGKLNQWIALGGVTNETVSSQSGISFSTSKQQSNQHQIYVKVDILEQ